MKTRSGPKAQGARPAHVSEVARPAFAPLKTLPSTVDELFQALAITVESSVVQSGSGAKSHSATQRYALPWVGFDSWHDARLRLEHFEKSFKGKIRWAPFNDSESNDGQMRIWKCTPRAPPARCRRRPPMPLRGGLD
jgi:hypothetical protein